MAENQDQLRRLEEQRNSVMAEDERKAALISVRLGVSFVRISLMIHILTSFS